MKSIIIRDRNDNIILHIKKTKTGAEARIANYLLPEITIKIIADDNSQIRLNNAKTKRGDA